MRKHPDRDGLRSRLLALLTAAVTLWAVAVTAGTKTFSSAVATLRTEAVSPTNALRWELGDLWGNDSLSTATTLAIGESPLLVSAREDVAKLWSKETEDSSSSSSSKSKTAELGTVTTPVTETPLKTNSDSTDNGIAARTLVPSSTSGYTVVGNAYISNSTKHNLSIQELQKNFAAELTDEKPQMLIIHTHGSEAYTPPKGTKIVYAGNHRTADARYSVIRVGDAMAKVFSNAGISVIHDRTRYDYPSYNKAYSRSLAAIRSYLVEYPSIHFILDVHRDAIEDAKGNEYKVISAIKGTGTSAQVTIVVGSDGSGLSHPRWKENLKLAVAIQQDALNKYPTLMRPILLRNSRYNQQATTGSLLVEVGAAGNSPDEAVLAGQLFAQRMVDVLQGRSK